MMESKTDTASAHVLAQNEERWNEEPAQLLGTETTFIISSMSFKQIDCRRKQEHPRRITAKHALAGSV